jgi:hypothetical protein
MSWYLSIWGGESDVNVLFSHGKPVLTLLLRSRCLGQKIVKIKGVVNMVVLEENKNCVQISFKVTV